MTYVLKRKPLIERLKSRFTINEFTSCWEWNSRRTYQGYGLMKATTINETMAHRISFKLNKGEIPEGLCVLHKCDNPPCVNPDHLFLGTRDTNNKDRAIKGRTVTPNMNLTHCKRGHEFNETNTTIRKSGTRLCRICNNAGTLRRYHARKP